MKTKDNNTKSLFSKVIDIISGIFMPILPVLMGTAILKGILILLVSLHVLEENDGIYQILYAASDAFFYFLPIFLAYTAAKKLKADPFIAMVIAAALLHPSITDIFASDQTLLLFGREVPEVTYSSSVIPIILAVILLHYLEKPLNQYLPELIRGFMKPILAIIIVLPITFLVFGPIGTLIGDLLTKVFFTLYDFNPVFAGAFFGLLIQPMVIVGAHWSLVPICIANIAANGSDPILPLLGAAVLGQAGAAFAVGLIDKNKKTKSMEFSATIAAILGVTEPALFGVNLPLMRPLISACIAGCIGGGLVGFSNASACSFAFPSFSTFVVYLGDGFTFFLASMVVGFIIGFTLTMLQKNQIKIALDKRDA